MLTETIDIKNVTLKNRVVVAPMMTDFWNKDGSPTERTIEIYRSYAESGAGLVVMEQLAVHPWGRLTFDQPRLYRDDSALALRALTQPFRDRGVPIVTQLNFGGRVSDKELLDEPDFEFVTPSGLPVPRKSTVQADSRALTADEIAEIVASFADAAHRAVDLAGFNGGVQIYASHGYLLSQFLSPVTNARTDRYGGSLANRARIVFETVEAVRARIGDAPLSVRLGASDRMPGEPEDGLTLAESSWIAGELAQMGVDWLSVSGNHCIYGIGADDNDTAYFEPYSRAIRDAASRYGVPVDCTGGIRTPGTAERLLQSQACDLIGIGRPLLKDKAYLSNWNL